MHSGPNKKPCLFFQKGSCNKGNQCNFAHVMQDENLDMPGSGATPSNNPGPKGKICRYFLEGKCNSGANCK